MNKYIYTILGSIAQKEIWADKAGINENGDLLFFLFESEHHLRPKEFILFMAIAEGHWEQFREANESPYYTTPVLND